jgi:glycosyltransferase involved in cell wall biosynthesis
MSPVGVNTEIIEHGVNGFLADDDEQWFEILSKLIENPELRKEIGKNGRKTIEEKYSVNVWEDKFLDLIRQTIEKKFKL